MPDDDRPDDVRADDARAEELLGELRRLAAVVDSPPAILVDSARATFGFSRLDDELARLVQDTALQPVGARGPDDPRMIAFAAETVAVDVEVTDGPDGRRLTGVVAGEVSELTVQTPVTTYPVEVDGQGRFRASGLAGSVLRLTMSTPSGRGVTTPWVRLDR